jgi:hypothetical protein
VVPQPVGENFSRYLKEHRDLTVDGLLSALRIQETQDAGLSFNPTGVRYYDRIQQQLQFTAEEKAQYRENGLVSVDHSQRYSMGSAYYAIYARELPVLITTDSILHALHRSYDEILKQLETEEFFHTVGAVLEAAHSELFRRAPQLRAAPLAESATDVDVYLSVARSLLNGAAADGGVYAGGLGGIADIDAERDPAPAKVLSKFGNDDKVDELLGLIASLVLQRPRQEAPTRLNGGARYIDYSQFRPRGHYTESEQLRRYFRALMWLGRADLGFVIDPPDPRSGLETKTDRERRSAALLTFVLRESQGIPRLQQMSNRARRTAAAAELDEGVPATRQAARARAAFAAKSKG